MLLYSRTQLAIASPHAIGILYILAIAGGCLIVGEDSNRGGKVGEEEVFVER